MNVSRHRTRRRLHSMLFAGLASTIQKNPALAGGAAALTVAMGLITVNAVWYQPAAHPSPIFATRTAVGEFQPRKFSNITTLVRTVSAKHPNRLKPSADANELTREIQSALSEKNLYSGALDGIYGAKTKFAILSYQKKMGLVQNGKVTPKLLSHILLSGKAVVRVPVPKRPNSIISEIEHRNAPDHRLVSAIQAGLKNYGYDDIVIDGVMGSQTSKAIKRFELDYGLKITGEPSKSLLKKLKDIGATRRG